MKPQEGRHKADVCQPQRLAPPYSIPPASTTGINLFFSGRYFHSLADKPQPHSACSPFLTIPNLLGDLKAGTTVHVWVCPFDSPTIDPLLENYDSVLNKEELERARRYIKADDSRCFRISRTLLRTFYRIIFLAPHRAGVSSQMRSENHFLQITIKIPVDLHFNVSHTKSVAVLALTAGAQVGVDVEDNSRLADYLSISHAFFNEIEIAAIHAQPELANQRFIEYWTLKESYIKAIGKGCLPINSFGFLSLPKKH